MAILSTCLFKRIFQNLPFDSCVRKTDMAFMGVCITSRPTSSGPEGLTLFLFVAGLIVSVIGLFFIKIDKFILMEEPP